MTTKVPKDGGKEVALDVRERFRGYVKDHAERHERIAERHEEREEKLILRVEALEGIVNQQRGVIRLLTIASGLTGLIGALAALLQVHA